MKAAKAIPALTEKDKARFWGKVDKNGPTQPHMDSPCWVWTGGRNSQGYGIFGVTGEGPFKAHRVAFVLNGGALEGENLYVLHRCDLPSCCNSSHLWAGTYAENNADREAKGRGVRLCGEGHFSRLHPERLSRGDNHYSRTNPERLARGDAHGSKLKPERVPRGESCGASKLTDDQVTEIRSIHAAGGISFARIAKDYGISDMTAARIIKRMYWKHIA